MTQTSPVTAALKAFVVQWNACGPNSDFGRYFQNIRDEAVKALAEQGSTLLPLDMPFPGPLAHKDACALSLYFNRAASLSNPQHYRINEWLKKLIANAPDHPDQISDAA